MLSKFSISKIGRSHVKHDMPCQDSSVSFSVPSVGDARFVVAVMADGVGSEDHSDQGAQVAVDTVERHLKEALEADWSTDNMMDLVEDSFEEALDAILNLADEQQEPFPKYASTLTAAVFDGSTLWFGHAGDDGIVVMRRDGSYGMVTERHKGELANSVIPFGEHNWQFGKEEDVASCVLMTDGVLDYCVGDELENNRVRLPFLKPLLYAVVDTAEEEDAIRRDWEAFLSASDELGHDGRDGASTHAFRDYTSDDLSIALLSNSEAVTELPEYAFDLETWDADTQRYLSAREDMLERLTQERLATDAAYRQLVLRGQREARRVTRYPVATHQHQAVADGDGAIADGSEVVDSPSADDPSFPAESTSARTEADDAQQDRTPASPDGQHDNWSEAVMSGARAIVREIDSISGALDDALRDLLRKP